MGACASGYWLSAEGRQAQKTHTHTYTAQSVIQLVSARRDEAESSWCRLDNGQFDETRQPDIEARSVADLVSASVGPVRPGLTQGRLHTLILCLFLFALLPPDAPPPFFLLRSVHCQLTSAHPPLSLPPLKLPFCTLAGQIRARSASSSSSTVPPDSTVSAVSTASRPTRPTRLARPPRPTRLYRSPRPLCLLTSSARTSCTADSHLHLAQLGSVVGPPACFAHSVRRSMSTVIASQADYSAGPPGVGEAPRLLTQLEGANAVPEGEPVHLEIRVAPSDVHVEWVKDGRQLSAGKPQPSSPDNQLGTHLHKLPDEEEYPHSRRVLQATLAFVPPLNEL
ncbi:unnamed protein product [Protopolystoma xenopodis]|uniref:Ig-like domain-containing protein n=1 Tax=Protopolystoma xenopodis TaxID=117903 RepID=A0A3S5ABI9_9PLAT|nr:unnamed protein product [Protopolystoma xenopodis]